VAEVEEKIKKDNEHNKRNEIVTQTVTNWTKQSNNNSTNKKNNTKQQKLKGTKKL